MMSPMQTKSRIPIRTLLLLLGIVTIVIVVFLLFGDAVEAWSETLIAETADHRLLVAAVLAGLLTVDVVVPIPSSLVSTACGMLLGLAGGTITSFVGMTGTVLAGYLIGRFAAGSATRLIGARESEMLHAFQERHGLWLLLAMRPVPVLAEASVLFSGISRQPPLPVFAVTAIGNLVVSLAYVLVGVWGRESGAFLPAFALSIGLSGGVMFLSRWMDSRHRRVKEGA